MPALSETDAQLTVVIGENPPDRLDKALAREVPEEAALSRSRLMKMIAEGKVLYEKECAQCHQPNGEGLKEMFYPVLAGQHYQYLLRQMTEIHDAKRLNVPTEMFKVISKYNNAQLVAISAYQASLKTPYSMLSANNAMSSPFK